MKPVPPVTKTFTAASLSGPEAGAYNRLSGSIEKRPQRRRRTTRADGAGVSNPRARQRALAIGIVDGREEGEPLAELKELLRTAGRRDRRRGGPAARRSPTPTATSAAASWPS